MGSTRPTVGVVHFLLAAIAVLLVGCGSSDGDTGRSSSRPDGTERATKAVTIRDYLYEPARISVPAGTTVTFANRDSTPHTATSKQQGAFESGSIDTGETGKVTLDEAGTFAYYCLFHPFMKGTIVIE